MYILFRTIDVEEKKNDAIYLKIKKPTSAAMKANVFSPPKNPTPTHTMNIKPDKTRIVDSNATSRK